jgi:hypothetical protein
MDLLASFPNLAIEQYVQVSKCHTTPHKCVQLSANKIQFYIVFKIISEA